MAVEFLQKFVKPSTIKFSQLLNQVK
jgi:hypothetical protein